MKLKWTLRALRQLADQLEYVARENPHAARDMGERIAQATRLLLEQPRIGRPGRVPGTREWVVDRTPYFVVYATAGDTVQILRVLHGKQHWPVS